MTSVRILFAVIIGVMVSFASAVNAADSWQIKSSPHSVDDTVDKMTSAIKDAGDKVILVIDHSAAAEKAGVTLPPTVTVIFGNPEIGTPLLTENRKLAIALPLRALIWQEGDSTLVGYIEPKVLAEEYGFAETNESIQAMAAALAEFTDAAIAP